MSVFSRAIAVSLCLLLLSQTLRGAETNAVVQPAESDHDDMVMSVLQQGLEAKKFWVRVHAAEFLIDLGKSQSLHAVAVRELKDNGENSPERIGAWRLAYRLASTDQVRKSFEAKLRTVAKDATASDHLHAVETLAKLKVQLPQDEMQAILAITREAGTDELAFGLWLAVVQGSDEKDSTLQDQLGSLLLSEDQMTKLRAAYALWSMSDYSPYGRDIIIKTGVRTAEQDMETEIEKMAGSRNIAIAWKVAKVIGMDDDIEKCKESSIQTLSDALIQTAEKSEEVSAILSDTLAELGSEEDRQRLLEYLAADNEDLRVSAAHALLKIKLRFNEPSEAGAADQE